MMNTKNRIKTILVVAVATMAIFAATSANAEITVDGYASWDSGINNSLTTAFSAGGADKLVVTVTGEHHFNSADGNVNSITYRGQTLVKAVEREPVEAATDTLASDIWYLDAPDSFVGTDEIIISFTGKNWVASAIRLSGTADGFGATAVSDPDSKSVDLTALGSDSLVLAVHGMGGSGNNADVVNVDAVLPAIELTAVEAGANYAGHVTSYTDGVGAGPATYSFTGGSTDGTVTIAAEFENAYVDPNLPTVDVLTPDTITWSGEPVALDATVVNNDSEEPQRTLSYLWSADAASMADTNLTIEITNADQEDATVTITKTDPTGDATVVTMTLAVTLEGEGPVPNSMMIDVYDDSCLAAKATGTVELDPTDFDENCITNLADFAEMTADWLVDYEITEPIEKP